jgi:ribosome-associated translation inhibitor RaiA
MTEIVEEKMAKPLERLLQKHFNEEIKEATLKVHEYERKGEYEVNFNMWLPGKEHIFAKKTADNFVGAITQLRESIEKELKKYREELGINN